MTTIAEANSIHAVVRSLHRNATAPERKAGLDAIEFLADRAHDRLMAGPGGAACARTLLRAQEDIAKYSAALNSVVDGDERRRQEGGGQ